MSDQITIKLPSAKVRRGIYAGLVILVFTIMLILLANLWSENQSLQDQVATLQRNATAQSTDASGTATTTSQPTIVDKGTNIIPAVTTNDHIDGNAKAKVFLVEYSDLECPFCKQFHGILPSILQQFGDNLGHVFRNFPLTIHANANMEAQLAECVANVAGSASYYKYVDVIFATTTSTGTGMDQNSSLGVAKNLGINADAVSSCYSAGQTKDRVTKDISDGTSAGIQGTPTIFIVRASDGKTKMIAGAVAASYYEQAITDLLNS